MKKTTLFVLWGMLYILCAGLGFIPEHHLTAVFLVLNILSVLWSEVLGNILYGILVIVSSPMVCCGGYAVSIFLWACLLIACIKYGKK